mmetsp:Transcript_16991/g.52749  ORF Transcript_16991/g.52749 Transcript_16991/m.52749 type:complete len:242 (-) Transcript_16991:76-801(-)
MRLRAAIGAVGGDVLVRRQRRVVQRGADARRLQQPTERGGVGERVEVAVRGQRDREALQEGHDVDVGHAELRAEEERPAVVRRAVGQRLLQLVHSGMRAVLRRRRVVAEEHAVQRRDRVSTEILELADGGAHLRHRRQQQVRLPEDAIEVLGNEARFEQRRLPLDGQRWDGARRVDLLSVPRRLLFPKRDVHAVGDRARTLLLQHDERAVDEGADGVPVQRVLLRGDRLNACHGVLVCVSD